MKSEIEKEFDKVGDEYFEKFGKRYPLVITDMRPLDEHINIMKKCIDSNKPMDSPEYGESEVY